MQSNLFDEITVANPCKVSWDSMRGDDRVRFCTHCRSKVFNLSEMNRAQAERLVTESLGKMCVRFYRRPDGTISTKSCGRSLGRLGRWALTATVLTFGIVGMVIAGFFVRADSRATTRAHLRDIPPIRYILNWLAPSPPPVVMGDVCIPPPAPPPTPTGENQTPLEERAP